MIASWLTRARVLPCGRNERLNATVHRWMMVTCLVEAGLAVAAAVYHAACAREHTIRRLTK